MSGQRVLVAGDRTADVAEAEAFAAELAPLLPRATRLAAAMLLDRAAAEDAVQDAAMRAWRRRGNRWPGTDLGPWFLAIVANCCRETRRSRWARVLRVGDIAENDRRTATPPDDPAGAVDVRNALRALGHDQRLVVALRYYLDLPFADVAAVAGCSVEAAKTRVRRAEASLRAALDTAEVSR